MALIFMENVKGKLLIAMAIVVDIQLSDPTIPHHIWMMTWHHLLGMIIPFMNMDCMFHPQIFFSTLPLASILCNLWSILTSSGCSCFSSNYQRTRLGRWNSTSQKHRSGIFDFHTLLPSMRKLGGRRLNSSAYGFHLTYSSHQ